jgi:hypothetical protein
MSGNCRVECANRFDIRIEVVGPQYAFDFPPTRAKRSCSFCHLLLYPFGFSPWTRPKKWTEEELDGGPKKTV